MKNTTKVENENQNEKFLVSFPKPIANGIKVYCDTMEVEPERFINDAVVKDLIRTFLNVQREDYMHLGDTFPTVKKPLKKLLETMKMAMKIQE